MGNYLNIGNAGFTAIRKGTYVDKSGLISFVNGTLGTTRKLTCVSRPRRFGKSFAAKMLCAYYDRTCDSRSLFADLRIAREADFEEHLNKYDVIYLDMTLFVSECGDIRDVVKNLQSEVIRELSYVYPGVEMGQSLTMALADIADATGSKFIFIIDEWDVLFREAKEDTELQKEYIQLLRSPVMVVELKWNKTAEGAIAQIKDKNYPQALEGFGGDMLLVGINYDEKSKKHTCVIEKSSPKL